MTTYYVTKEQLNLLNKVKELDYALTAIYSNYSKEFYDQFNSMDLGKETAELQEAVLRYLGGDETIEFKVKAKMYCLWRIDGFGEIVYMNFSHSGTPASTTNENNAFTAPLEEIKKWKNPAWLIMEA